MKQITLQMIIDKILDDAKGNMGCGIMLLAFLGAIIIMAGASIFSVYIIIPFLFFGVPGIVLLLKSRKNRKKSKNKSFYIVTDVCCDKKTKYDSDGDSFFLTFEKTAHIILTTMICIFVPIPLKEAVNRST